MEAKIAHRVYSSYIITPPIHLILVRAEDVRVKEEMARLIEHHRSLLNARESTLCKLYSCDSFLRLGAWSGERQQFELNICSLREQRDQSHTDRKDLEEKLATEKNAVAALEMPFPKEWIGEREERGRSPNRQARGRSTVRERISLTVSKTGERQRVAEELLAAQEREAKLREELSQEATRCLMKDAEILKSIEQMQERARALSQVQSQYASVY